MRIEIDTVLRSSPSINQQSFRIRRECAQSRGVAASVVNFVGGGVQPASLKKVELFGADAPIRRFLANLDASLEPNNARKAGQGIFAIELFPALALPSIEPSFLGWKAGPKYNPENSNFRLDHWRRVILAAQAEAVQLGCCELATWLEAPSKLDCPSKADQDRLDAAICLLVAIRWRLSARQESIVIGDSTSGYIVSPVSEPARARLVASARKKGVLIDGHSG